MFNCGWFRHLGMWGIFLDYQNDRWAQKCSCPAMLEVVLHNEEVSYLLWCNVTAEGHGWREARGPGFFFFFCHWLLVMVEGLYPGHLDMEDWWQLPNICRLRYVRSILFHYRNASSPSLLGPLSPSGNTFLLDAMCAHSWKRLHKDNGA